MERKRMIKQEKEGDRKKKGKRDKERKRKKKCVCVCVRERERERKGVRGMGEMTTQIVAYLLKLNFLHFST